MREDEIRSAADVLALRRRARTNGHLRAAVAGERRARRPRSDRESNVRRDYYACHPDATPI